MYIFEYFLFLKSWLWHSINIGNEICNTYKSCLKLLLPCCCLDKQKRQVHQKIAGLSLNQLFMNLRIHYFIIRILTASMRPWTSRYFLFLTLTSKKKVAKKNKQILYMHPFWPRKRKAKFYFHKENKFLLLMHPPYPVKHTVHCRYPPSLTAYTVHCSTKLIMHRLPLKRSPYIDVLRLAAEADAEAAAASQGGSKKQRATYISPKVRA